MLRSWQALASSSRSVRSRIVRSRSITIPESEVRSASLEAIARAWIRLCDSSAAFASPSAAACCSSPEMCESRAATAASTSGLR